MSKTDTPDIKKRAVKRRNLDVIRRHKQVPTYNSVQKELSLRQGVERAVKDYFHNLGDQDVFDVYDMVLAEVEVPLLEVVMDHARHNQTRAASLLGLNRGTLRKKLKRYGIL